MKDTSFLFSNIIAHRGIFDKYHIENTMDAFSLACRYGFTIELDIHLLKDNNIVVFHDDNLKRLTGIDKNLRDCTINDIKNISNVKIPLLSDVLNMVNGKVPIIIEYKFDSKYSLLEKESVKLLDNYNGKFAVQSFNPLSLLWFKLNRPNYIRGLLVSDVFPGNFFVRFILGNRIVSSIIIPDYIGCNLNMLKNNKCSKYRGKYILIGYTIKSPVDYLKYYPLCDNLICNIKKESINRFLVLNKQRD